MHMFDCKLAALGGPPGHINDLFLAWLQAGGATSDNINDAQMEFLVAQGIPKRHINDMWYEYFGNSGCTQPALNDREYCFWCGQGGKAGNLIKQPFAMDQDPPWESGLGIVKPLGNGVFRYTSGQLTTTSLVNFYVDAPSMVGRTFEIGAEFSMRNEAGDYRLALAEYNGVQWNGASTGDVDAATVIDDPTWVSVTVQHAVTNATTDRMRFAVQLVNPTTTTMAINVRNPYMIEV